MMPLKPRPNTAETVKSPASLWVAMKPTMALTNGTGQDRAQPADAVCHKAPDLPAQKSEPEQHRNLVGWSLRGWPHGFERLAAGEDEIRTVSPPSKTDGLLTVF